MQKRYICLILTLSFLLSLFPTQAFAVGLDSDKNLVAHWDFEGETLEEKLADKATGGTVADNLTEYYPGKDTGASSPIRLAEGAVQIPRDELVYLAADNSSDLSGFSEYTLFSRLEISGKPNAFADIFFKSGFIRLYLNNKGNAGAGDYAIEFRQNGNPNYLVTLPSTWTVRAEQMISIAVSVKQDAERKFTVVLHLCTDGQTWKSTEPVTFSDAPTDYIGSATSLGEASKLAIGKATPNAANRNADFKLYDVRIYDMALDATAISSIPLSSKGETPEVLPEAPEKLLANWSFDELRGDTATDSVSGRKATLVNASFDKGISGNGVLLNAAKNGMIDFGERGLTEILEGKEAYSVSMWILPSYYSAKQTTRLLTIGANESGKALLDIHWAKNNATERKGISITVRSDYRESGKTVSEIYTLPESVIGNLNYTSSDQSKTFAVWQLLTVTVDLKNGTCQVFINQNKLSSFSFVHAATSFSAGTGTLTPDSIGFCAAAPSYMAFNGYVDEFRLFEGVLTNDQIASHAAAYTDANSPTADQKLVDALIARLGDGAVLYTGSSNALLNGFTVKLDPSDYSKKPYFKRSEVYAPVAFAEQYFQTDVQAEEDGYVNLTALCKEKGYGIYSSISRRIAVILPNGVESFDNLEKVVNGYSNEQYLNRMLEFFDNPYQPEPNNDAEQTRTVVFRSDDDGQYVYSPSICTLDGVLYASCDIKSNYTRIFRSKDGGVTWEQIGKIDGMRCSSLFAYEGKLYLLGLYINTAKSSIGICGVRSMSGDKIVWTGVSPIHCEFIEKSGHCAPTPVLFANGRAYMAFEDSNVWAEENGKLGTKKAFVISCDLEDNLLSGSNWICSNYVTITADWFKETTGATSTAHHGVPTLEGNMVQAPDGTLYNMLRLNCEPDHSKVVMLEVSADGKTISIPEENSIVNFPGGENKFSIYYDESTGYYMSLVNNNTAPYWQMQRNVLSLSVSKDLIHWEVVETVLVDRTMLNFDVSMATHAFQYVDWCIDGEDIVFTVRETMGESSFYHNGYEMTFYRLSDYKRFLPKSDVTDDTLDTENEGETNSPEETTPTDILQGGCRSLLSANLAGAWALAACMSGLLLKKRKKQTTK